MPLPFFAMIAAITLPRRCRCCFRVHFDAMLFSRCRDAAISLPPRHLFRFHFADADAAADAADAAYCAVTPLFSCRRFHFHA
jgi:hypothetical protein